MKISRSKIFFVVSDVLIAVYLLVAFCSFDKKGGNHTPCNKVSIDIADNATSGFIDTKIIKDRLQKSGIYPIGKEMCKIDTRRIEDMLNKSPFVQTANCYKTEGGHVYISVTQRMPVIRIKADNGDDYYVDDNDCVMPTTHYTSDLIIATGSINRWYATNYLSPLGRVIMANEMWGNLIEQINVLPNRNIEIVPRIGDHIVHLGSLPDCKDRTERFNAIQKFMDVKMKRLLKFYKYGLSEVGWNKYSYIDIEFDNQIICRKKSVHHASATTVAAPVAPEPTAEQAQTMAEQAQPDAASKPSIAEQAQAQKQTETKKPAAKDAEKKSVKETEKKSVKETEKKSVNTEKKTAKDAEKKKAKAEKTSKDNKPEKKKSSNKR